VQQGAGFTDTTGVELAAQNDSAGPQLGLPQMPSGENLTFGTLANRSKPAETQASSRYHPLRSHH
jgi:hypothetical protein